jgi:hypothetical protein
VITWIASYPRSGNTLVRLLLHHLHGLSSSSVFDDPGLLDDGSAQTIGHVPLPAPLDELARRPELHLVKTHRLDDAATAHPAVYVVRDGRDALVSCAHYQGRYGGPAWLRSIEERSPRAVRGAAFRRRLRRMMSDTRFGGWSRNVMTWHERSAPTVVIRYEDLLERPREALRDLCATLGLPTLENPAAGVPSFESLRSRWPAFFRRGIRGAWQDEMPDEVHTEFWRLHGHGMRRLGYT